MSLAAPPSPTQARLHRGVGLWPAIHCLLLVVYGAFPSSAADIAAHPKGRWLLAVDEQKHELIVLKRRRNSLEVAARHTVSPYPVSVAISPDGQRVSVASLWSRKVTIFEPVSGKASAGATIKQVASLSLPFNPRVQTYA